MNPDDRNPNPIQDSQANKLDPTSSDLRGLEEKAAAGNHPADSVRERENEGGGDYIDNFTGNQTVGGKGSIRLKGKGSTAFIVAIIGGFMALGSLATLPFAAFAAIDMLNLDLDDVTPSSHIRVKRIMSKRFVLPGTGDPVSLGCTSSKVPLKCKYRTMSKKMVERYKRAGIEITGESTGFFGRTKVTEVKFGDKVFSNPADAWTEMSKGGGEHLKTGSMANAHWRAHNMSFLGMHGDTMVNKVMKFFKVSRKIPELRGNRQDRVNRLMTAAGVGSIDGINFTKVEVEVEDGDGNKTTVERWKQDGTENLYTEDQYKEINKNLEKSKGYIAKRNSRLGKAGMKALGVMGAGQLACSVVQTVGAAALAAKVLNSRHMVEFALPFLTLVGALKSQTLTPEEAEKAAETIGDVFLATDARKTIGSIAVSDEKKAQGGDANVSPDNEDDFIDTEVNNPNYGKNALDSETFKVSINGGVPAISPEMLGYSLGFGANSFLNGAAAGASVASNVINLGTNINVCDFINSWKGQLINVVVSVFLGVFSGGGSIAVSVATAVPIMIVFYLAQRWFNDFISGNPIPENIAESPVEVGNAIWTGAAALHSQDALARGMVPGTVDQIMAYQNTRNEYAQDYIALQKQESSPFDIKNPYSITGSIAVALQRSLPNNLLDSSLSSLPVNLSSFVFSGLASSLKPASSYAQSLNPDRYKQCDDVAYEELGIDADIQCNVRFVLPKEVLSMDPITVAEWMETEGYVPENTADGLPEGYKPITEAEKENFAVAFVKDTVKSYVNDIYNTRSYGSTDRGATFGKFLDYCVHRTMPLGKTFSENSEAWGAAGEEWVDGRMCTATKDHNPDGLSDEEIDMLNHFRAYVFDQSVNQDLEESPILENINCGPFGSSSGGSVGVKISQNEVEQIISKYNLPAPEAETKGNVTGYNDLVKQIQENPDAAWAVQALLNGEKTWKATGGHMIEYLNTAWMWMENGQDMVPDPYQINCGESAENSAPSVLCTTQNWQVAGYQAGDKAVLNQYTEVFNKLYPNYTDDDLRNLLKEVLQNSDKAFLDKWNYNDSSQQTDLVSEFKDQIDSATTADIATNLDNLLGNRRTQFFTILLGKDPNMVAALNSYAVTDDDIGAMLQNPRSLGWSNDCGTAHEFYCSPDLRPRISNMIMALYMFDGQGPSGGASCARNGMTPPGGTGMITYQTGPDGQKTATSMIWAYQTMNVTQSNNEVNDWVLANPDMYDYSIALVGYLSHPGMDIGMPYGTGLFSPVNGEVVIAGGSGYYNNDLGGGGELRIKIDGSDDIVILGHMSQIDVVVGQRVFVGQPVGASGTAGSGAHLHLEYRTHRPDGSETSVEPADYL